MRVVVAGAGGLVGRYVADDLEKLGYEVIRADCAERVSNGRLEIGDLTILSHAEKIMAGADVVIHLARVPFPYCADGYDPQTRTWRKPDRSGDAAKFIYNLNITSNILTAAQSAGVKKVVMGSSFTVYGLYYPSRPLLPDYLTVDEGHPRRPDDPYSLTN
jgi:nucleoside-diphosphate-sugar epimerase